MDEQRRLLAELMGTSSHGIESYRDDRVCKRFLAGVCPAMLLSKSKEFQHIVGFCDLVHEEAHKREFEAESDHIKDSLGYFRILERELDICVRRGRFAVLPDVANTARVELEKLPFVAEDKANASSLLSQAYAAGIEGKVKLAQQLTDEALNILRASSERMQNLWAFATRDAVFINSMELSNARRQLRENTPKHKQQCLVACEDCGSLLGLLDSDERLAEHFTGKVHLSWVAIRSKWRELKERNNRSSGSGGGNGGGGRREWF